jgi:hypothetical protein
MKSRSSFRHGSRSPSVVVFRRSLSPISRYLDYKLGPGDVIIGEFDVIEVQGSRSETFDEPALQRTAAALAAYLRDRPRIKADWVECSAKTNAFWPRLDWFPNSFCDYCGRIRLGALNRSKIVAGNPSL